MPDPERRIDVPINVLDSPTVIGTNRRSGPASPTADYTVVVPIPRKALDAVDRQSETAVLPFRGTSLDEGWLFRRSTLDAVLDGVECDVFVENIGIQNGSCPLYIPGIGEYPVVSLGESAEETTDSILLPVETGPHAALATEAARAIARAARVAVTVYEVAPDASDGATNDTQELLQFAKYIPGSDIEMTAEFISDSNTTDVIIQHAQEHDVISIGASEAHSGIKHLIFDSVQETLTNRSDVTVLMARDADHAVAVLSLDARNGNRGQFQ